MQMTDDKMLIRRLPLSQVLLEEYQSLEQPPLSNQGNVDDKLREMAKVISQHRKHANAPQKEAASHSLSDCLSSKSPGAADTSTSGKPNADVGDDYLDHDGDLVKALYRLMVDAQKSNAKRCVEKRRTECAEQLGSSMKDLNAEELKKVVDKALIMEILGVTDDLVNKYRRRFAAEKDPKILEHKIESALIREIRKRSSLPEEADGANSKGTGDGKTKQKDGMTVKKATRLAALTQRSALCLSGGGIRSATFNLGILQGLARHGLLERFDYLSTVSGGGFIGGWLTAWLHREGLKPVIRQLTEPPKSPLKPEPKPIEHLRIYSNYLSPQTGLLSIDSWTLLASVLRNLMINWLVFLPALFALTFLPRLWTTLLFGASRHASALPLSLGIGIVTGLWSFFYIGWHLPSANPPDDKPKEAGYKVKEGSFLFRCMLFMTISAASFAIFFWVYFKSYHEPIRWYWYVALTESLIIGPWLVVCVFKLWSKARKRFSRSRLVTIVVIATLLIAVAQLLTAYLLRVAIRYYFSGPTTDNFFYPTFAVPLLLVLMCVGGTLIGGFTSRVSNDDDQEWWARTGGWVLIVAVSWSVVCALVLYGPLMILALGSTYVHLSNGKGILHLPWKDIAKVAGTAVGLISGIITLFGGFSAKTPANAKEAQQASVGSLALSALTILGAPIFMAFFFVLISLSIDLLLGTKIGLLVNEYLGCDKLPFYPTDPLLLTEWHKTIVKTTWLRFLIPVWLAHIALSLVMGRLINTNNFSLQQLWRNRIIRAYLGASHKERRPDAFTGFDTYDNLLMHELRPQPSIPQPPPMRNRATEDRPEHQRPKKLFHILNIALNLTGGEKLQWQDRRAESFTVSPLHSGSYWLGYRRSLCYGGEEGISLGAAIAISGAFVSPNMGYMMGSAVVRFLMALFNVRFGTWLGNPGPAGDEDDFYDRSVKRLAKLFRRNFKPARPFQLRSPRFSVKPIVSEAFGLIDDKSSYVYLSDGGHFENLGLYEMVLRRCRFIVVSDASTDPDYQFQSLAMSVRQIRVDLGVPIDMPAMSVNSPSQELRNKYCAIGKIRYSCVDRDPDDPDTEPDDFDGVLIYIKPSLIGEEPRDVVNYWQGSNGFPQEVITDQWFSEAQFESYRALGSHIIDAICDPEGRHADSKINFASFARKAQKHNQLDFRAYREQISYTALEETFKTSLGATSIDSYTKKVRRFLSKLLR